MQGFTGLIASNLAPTGIVLSRDGPPQGRRCLHVYHSKRPQGPSTLTLLAARHPHFFAGASIMVNRLTGKSVLLLLALGALAPLAQAADAPTLNTGSTAWMITAAVLVLFMCLPGLALFYGGLVRAKNMLSLFTQCFGVAGLVGVLWVIYGYSMVVDTTG